MSETIGRPTIAQQYNVESVCPRIPHSRKIDPRRIFTFSPPSSGRPLPPTNSARTHSYTPPPSPFTPHAISPHKSLPDLKRHNQSQLGLTTSPKPTRPASAPPHTHSHTTHTNTQTHTKTHTDTHTHAHTYVLTHMHTQTHTHTHIHKRTHIQTHTHTHTHTHAHTYTHAHTNTQTHTQTHTHTNAHTPKPNRTLLTRT